VPDRGGDYDVTLEFGGATATRTVTAVDDATRQRPIHEASVVAIAGARPIEAISVTYPRAAVGIAWFSCHWSIPFLTMMAVFAWALRRRLGVML
jgi:hypothetical protein